MRHWVFKARLLASALSLFAPAANAAEDNPLAGLPHYEGKTTVNDGAVAIEGTMLAATAFNGAASQIGDAVKTPATGHTVLVLGNADTLDFGAVAMFETEIESIAQQLTAALQAPETRHHKGPVMPFFAPAAIIPAVTAVAGMFRTDTEISPVAVTLDSRILTAAVARRVDNAILPGALVGAQVKSKLKDDFDALGTLAEKARVERARLAATDPKDQAKVKLDRLDAALKRYDGFFERVTTADKGVVPVVAASRLSALLAGQPLILRVNAEKAGGTLLKRTNLMTFFGADGVSISAGLVASYELTEPETGKVTASGVVSCRTGITKLKAVQDETWKPSVPRGESAAAPPAAICRTIPST